MNKKSLSIYLIIIVGIIIIANLLSERLFLRIDVTEDQRYSLSEATEDILSDLPETVTITAYFTEDLPPQYMVARREFKQLLIEYANRSHGDVVYEFINPNKNEESEKLAMQSGIQPLVINLREKDQVKQQKAFMGAVVQLAGEKEVIPFVQPGGSYEYALSSAIKKLAVMDKPKVGILAGQGEAKTENFGQAYKELSVLYDIESVEITDTTNLLEFATLAIINPKDSFSIPVLRSLDYYLSQGGDIFIALNRVEGDFTTGQGSVLNTGLESWLAQKGVVVEPTFVVDAKCGSVGVSRQQMGFNFTQNVRFPYFPLVSNFPEHPITEGIQQAIFPMASPISFRGDTALTFTPLILSGKQSGTQSPPLYFDVNKQWVASDFTTQELVLGAVIEGNFNGVKSGKIVVIADGDFAINGTSDQKQQKLNPENVSLLVNSIDYLSDDTGLIQLRAKGINSRPLEELSETKVTFLKWFNFLFPIVLIIGIGVFRAHHRKIERLKRRQHGYV